MTDQQIVPGAGPTPVAITLDTAQQLLPKLAFAAYDGTGAAGAFLPVVKFVGPGGLVAGQAVGDVVTAGASVDQTWFRGVSKQGASGGTTDREQLQSNAVTTIPSASADYLDWNKLGGSDLLDLTNPKAPTVKAAGVYAITTTAICVSATTGANFYHQLAAGSPDFPEAVQTAGPSTVVNQPLTCSCSLTYYLQANVLLSAYVYNFDTVTHGFRILRATVQRVS